jgi:hypothetical protein
MKWWVTLMFLLAACGSKGPTVPTNTGGDCLSDDCRSCLPVCDGKECGDDGCGGQCGSCIEDQVCLSGTCGLPCQRACGKAECGDDGCGGSCGDCEGASYCLEGLCVPSCSPQCTGKECGDDGCGGDCGKCPGAASVCVEGICQADCTDACSGKACGSDGCGGSCGQCPDGHLCLADGTCQCQPACGQGACGDDGCGGDCGSCTGAQESCQEGICACTPACVDKECGDDGCNGSCGECPENHECLPDGQCLCVPDCMDKECGGDGCTGLCGECGCGEDCTLTGHCLFTACVGKECGDDGCQGLCGSCDEGAFCVAGTCPPPGQSCFDGNSVDWDGCTDGEVTEFQLNQSTSDDQTSVALASAGQGYLAVWQSEGEDGNGPGIFARYFPDFGPPGAAFGVNQETYGAQKMPAIAASPKGYLLAWESTGQDGFMEGIFARLCTAQGIPSGAEFQVNQFANAAQLFPAVSPLPGGWLVLWQSPSMDGSGTAVVGRRFTAAGLPEGDEFVVNSELLHDQGGPTAAVFPDGRSLVAWNSFQQDGSNWGIAARRFAISGEAMGVEFLANSTTESSQVWPAAAALGDTDTVIAWQSLDEDGEGYGIYGQRFGPTFKLGPQFPLNQTMAGEQQELTMTALPGGGFAAAWSSCPSLGSQLPGQDLEGCAVVWRVFDNQGVPVTDESVANIHGVGNQQRPAIAATSEAIILAWESCPIGPPESGQDASGCGIFARRFLPSGEPLYH